jgi:hypothetical protein
MITLHPTPQQIERAKNLYDFDALKGSITKGKSNIYGALGEILCLDYFPTARKEESYDYDLIIKNYRVDVKTKRTTVPPQKHYRCSVTHLKQETDYYFFLRITEDLSLAYLLGYLSKQEMIDNSTDIPDATHIREGHHVEIQQLHPFSPLL